MGSNDGDPDERPVHPVTLRAFRIDLTEVTVEDYGTCADAGLCRPMPRTAAWPGIRDDERRFFSAACNGATPGRRNHPANCVDWNDARSYCAFRGGRLPTEAEWEYAARGRRGQPFPWGDAAPSPALANAVGLEAVTEWARRGRTDAEPLYRDGTDGYADTAPVGTYPQGASPFGVLDMAGNVWEWVEDAYAASYADASNRGEAHEAPDAARVFRGGGYTSDRVSWLQATNRASAPQTYRSPDIGFRCAYPSVTIEQGASAPKDDGSR